jgi:S-DNA-T family DNA segregation ATPase FtsK/SpoIIIE
MSEQRDDEDEPGAEVVQLHPPEPGQHVEPAQPDRKVIYADITTAGERRPVIPVPLQPDNIRDTAVQWAGLQWHRSRYHGLRLLFYVLAVLVWAVIGAGRVVIRQIHWAWLLESHALRSEAVAAGDAREWRALHKAGQEARKVRLIVLGAEAVALIVAVSVLARYGRPPEWGAAAAVGVVLLARAGRPEGHRIISPAVVPPQYQEPTPAVITTALGSLGITAIDRIIKADPGHSFCITPVMQSGPGWGVQIDLPHGVTAGHIIAKRPELASGLRRPLSAVWPGAVPEEHEGRLDLWVGFHDLTKVRLAKYPLLKTGTADVFDSVPFGTDPRQRGISTPLFELNWLIGASPGQGKTAVLRVLASGAALDVLCDLWIHEHSGKGDLEPFAQVSHRYCSGLDDEAIGYAAASIRMLKGELERRSALFKTLPKEARPDGKITRELAGRIRGLRPIVAVFDEAQNIFMHPELGPEAAVDLAHLMRLGRAYGIIIVLATQRPDKDSVPTAISGVVTARFCLKVPDQLSNDMVLGTGAYRSGYNAAIFRARTDAGLGWLKADGEPQIVRTYYLNEPASRKIADRARVMRDRAGVLSGYALGLEDEPAAPRDVLADVLDVFGDAPALHWDALAERLAGRWPERWASLSHIALSAQCRNLGVPSVTVSMAGAKDKGCRKVAVQQALGVPVSAQVTEGAGNRS